MLPPKIATVLKVILEDNLQESCIISYELCIKWKTVLWIPVINIMLQTNVAGTFNVIRQAAELINENEGNADQQRGVIINTSSIAAFDGQIGMQNFSSIIYQLPVWIIS